MPWREALERLQLGGERTYGWGRLALGSISPETDGLFNRYVMNLSGAHPGLTLGNNDHLLAHTLASGPQAVTAHGRIAPLVGRETVSANAHGRNLSQAAICWEPGSILDGSAHVSIGPNGIWEAAAA